MSIAGILNDVDYNYPIIATLNKNGGDNGNYYIYTLKCLEYIEANADHILTVMWKLANGEINEVSYENFLGVSLIEPEQMQDEHDHIIIKDDRTISSNSVVLIAEDSNSQMVTFEIDELYDGISILTDSKKV
jgi:hypothetical protein